MCIFIRAVQRVANTRILVMPYGADRQLTIYENHVTSLEMGNAMILPVPSNGSSGDRPYFVDLSSTKESIWEICEQAFPPPTPTFGSGSSWGPAIFALASDTLPVERIGGYTCSYAPSIEALDRVSQSHFKIAPNVAKTLKQHYSAGFGFVICTFDRSVRAHPIAYTSALLPNGHLFIPTHHEHGEEEAKADANEPIHEGIHCDVCRSSPVRGARWKCADCPDYDMCDPCYQKYRGGGGGGGEHHSASHAFIHYPRPMKRPQFQAERPHAEDGYDHKIYVVNANFHAPPNEYNEKEEVHVSSLNVHTKFLRFFSDGLKMQAPAFQFITRVSIRGTHYPNQDYSAVPYKSGN